VDSALWQAVNDLADEWSRSPTVQRFATVLREARTGRAAGVARTIQEAHAAYGFMTDQPLRQASFLPIAEEFDWGSNEARAFLVDATRVERAFFQTVLWLRSRLPGYPMLRLPHLVTGTALSNDEFTLGVPWLRQYMTSGIQYQAVPPGVPKELQLAERAQPLNDAAIQLSRALAVEPTWQRFAASQAALDDQARADLAEARRRARDRLAPAEIDAYEPNLTMRRHHYRQHVLSEVLQSLEGAARVYCDAFTSLLAVLELVGDVFAQLVAYGPVVSIGGIEDLHVTPGDPPIAAFRVRNVFPPLRSSQLVLLDDPLVSDCLRLTKVTYSFGAANPDLIDDLAGQVLPGSGAVLAQKASQ
jgi:hypothetical protein